jgi:hypothetical protein
MARDKHSPAPWLAFYEASPCVALPGWQIKEGTEPHCPIAVVAEPQGGKKVNGKSPRQVANAHLITAAPKLLAAGEKILAVINDLADSNPGFLGKLVLQDYARYNEALIELPQAIAEARGKVAPSRRRAA